MIGSKKARTVAIQKSIENRLKFPICYFDSRKYIQHNVLIEDGLGPILAFMDSLPADRTRVQVFRSLEDGDYSVAHAEYELGDWGRMVGFEVHRWEDDRIVEHWDNLQPVPAAPNPSGRTMTDGPSEIFDTERTIANKAVVEQFTSEVLIGGRLDRISAYFRAGSLIQHNPQLADGIASLHASLEAGRIAYHRLHKLFGEGNLVLAMCEGVSAGDDGSSRPVALYDMYRLEDGLIAEHWDVIEVIAPREAWKNDNGKF